MPLTISPGVPFGRERDMAAPVVEWLTAQRLMVKPEFVLPWGIPDFVAVRLRSSAIRLRLKYGQRKCIGPPSRVQVLWSLPDVSTGKSVGIRSLRYAFKSCYDDKKLETELSHLRRDKFAVSPQNGRYQKLNGWAPLHSRIVAVELKLNRVSEAFNQALLNRAIATESFVALPERLAMRVLGGSKAAEFRENGLGLMSVGIQKCRVLISPSPRLSTFDEVLQAHCVERFWRTRDSSS